MKVKLEEYAFLPSRAHDTDAGIDLRSPFDVTIQPGSSVTIYTGVHVELPHNTAGILVSKSGLNVNHGILSTGLIDEGYQGEILVKLYNHGKEPYWVKRGEKITQLVVVPTVYEGLEIVRDFDTKTARGDGGFGSTGR